MAGYAIHELPRLIGSLLFIGFRGTRFLFDWKTNLRCRLVPASSSLTIFNRL